MSAIASPFANSMRGGRGWQKDYSVQNYNPVTSGGAEIDPGGDTKTFMGSIVNTMRYMLSGMLMGTPTMMFHSAFEAAKEFDYQLEKARQNFVIKDPKMWNQAIEQVSMRHGDVKDKEELNKLVKEESNRLIYEIRDGAVERLQNIAITYAVPTAEISKAWQIASRITNSDDEAIAFTREVAKVRTLEQVDVEKAAMGFEAVKSQWGLNGYQLEKFNNMMIKAANISTATVEDLLDFQKRAGSIMRNNLEGAGLSKNDAAASSIAFASLFSQGSGRSGAEGGTFAKAVTERPYQSAQAEYFKKKAEQLNIEELNPYKIDEFGNVHKRAFTDWFAALSKAMVIAMPTDQTEILKQAAGVYHSGSSAAIQAMITDMQKNAAEIAKRVNNNRRSLGLEEFDPKADMDKIMKEYIKKISEATPEESEVMLAGMSTTWNFQIDRVKAMWESSTFRVLDALKPEFQDLTTTLGVLLRSMRENATTWAQAITGITNIGMMLAVGYGMNTLYNKWKGFGQQTRMDEIDRQRGLLQAERGAISLRKDLLEDRLAQFHSQHGKEIERFNAVKDEKVYKSRTELMQAEWDVQQARDNYERRKGTLTPFEDEQERAKMYSLERTVADKRKVAEEQESKHGLDSKVLDEYSRLQTEMAQVAVQATRLNQRMDMLDRGAQQWGVDVSQLQVKMDRLDKEFRNGSINMDMYNQMMKETARAAGVAEDNIERLQKEMDKLEREFREGGMSARVFNKQVDHLRNMHLAGDAALPGGGYGGRANQGGADMLNMVAQASLFGALMGGFSDRSIFTRTGDLFALMKEAVREGSASGFIRSFGSFFGRGLERDENGKIVRDENGRVRKRQLAPEPEGEQGKGRGAMSRLATSSPRLAGALGGGLSMLLRLLAGGVGLGLLTGGFAAFTYGMANDNEKTQIDIQQFKDIEKNVMAMKESSSWFIRSVVGVKEIIDTLTDGVKSILTDGSLDGFRKHGNAWVMGWNAQTPKEFEQQMEAQAGARIREQMVERYGEAEVKRREQVFSEMYFKEAKTLEDYKKISHSFLEKDRQKTEEEEKKLKEFSDRANGVITYETMQSIQEFLEPIKRKLEVARSNSETGYEVAKTKALLSGMREDSEQVRKLTNDFLKAQIGLLRAYTAQIDEKMKEMINRAKEEEKKGKVGEVEKVMNSPEFIALQLDKNTHNAQIVQMQLQMHQTDLSAISSITTKLERAKRMAQAEGNIRRSNLLLGGAKEDSMAVKMADRQTMLNINNQIGQAIVELQKQLNSGKFQGEDRNDILLQIKELQAESRDNLVKIREKMTNSLSTYNLPSGIQGMTFQEAMQRKNDYRSYAITQGGLTINVNVPVQGNFGDEKVAKQRGQATARQVAQEVSNILSRQVKSFGAGVGYFSPFAVGRT
jgi:TP901 family phage tail tape measure protein